MAFLLRKISGSRWRLPGDPSSDALRCLNTENGELSLWTVEDDQRNLDSVILALASNCEHVSNIDYCMVPRQDIEELGIILIAGQGDTPAVTANHWHVDAKELTARKLAAIASAMYAKGTRGRKRVAEIKRLLKGALAAQTVARAAMNSTLIAEVE